MNCLAKSLRRSCHQCTSIVRRQRYSDFPKDDNSKFKYWEHEYSERTSDTAVSEDGEPYHSMYERRAKAALSHLDADGRAKMVDVSGKSETIRTAVARAR